ncbi:acyltransferase [Fibrobacter sp. UBA2449]|uniref:acyltransferase n=1 Tax=Fibrobacter sp. UBA2449 TaxID=1946529 RepID=UPI0025B83815|nr:acyltransferase [Fibrobacter sp. UBA2449]
MFKQIKKIIEKILLAPNTSVEDYVNTLRNRGVNVGNNVSIISLPHTSSEPYLISIGDNTTISFEVAFITHDAATRVIRNLPDGNPETVIYGTIEIGSNCFIGARTTILPNVKIGNNSIIGACSLVNQDIPNNVVAAGNPCKVICSLDEYLKKHQKDFLYMVSLPYEEKKEYLTRLFKGNGRRTTK